MELKSKLIGPIFFFSILLLISHQGYAGVKKNGYDGLLKSCYSNYESREVIKFKKCSKQLLKQYPDYAGGYIANAILSNWANRANSAYDYLLTASNKKLNKDTECDLNLWLARILGTKNEYDKSLRYYNLAQKKCEFVISKEQSEDLVDEMDKIKKLNIQRNQKNTAQQSPAVIENIKKIEVITEPPGANIEVNNEYVGKAPLIISLATWNDYFDRDYKITALPTEGGDCVQTKRFAGGNSDNKYNDHIPRRIFFSMGLCVDRSVDINIH